MSLILQLEIVLVQNFSQVVAVMALSDGCVYILKAQGLACFTLDLFQNVIDSQK